MEKQDNSLFFMLDMPAQKNMSDRLYSRISGLIQEGKLPAGYIFPNETVLCQQLKLGRSSIREAYKALELSGYITRTKKGTVVNDNLLILEATPLKNVALRSSAEDFLEFRFMLEEQTAAVAAEKATKKDIDYLTGILDRLDQAQNRSDAEEMCDLDVAFHTGIAEATHNSMIIASMAAVASVWRQETAGNFMRAVKQGNVIFDRMNRQHRGILEAINNRDGQTAKERMHEHILDMSRQNL